MTSGAPPAVQSLATTRAMVLGVLVTIGVAWFVTVPGVVLALVGGGIPVLLAPRFGRPGLPAMLVAGGVVLGALIGVLALGHGRATYRLGAVIVTTLATGPWLAIAAFLHWSRRRSVS